MQASLAAPPDAPRARSAPRPAAPERPGHAVQFYEGEAFLYDVVADFLAAGLARGQSAVVIATRRHRAGFTAHLEGRGVDVAALRRGGRLAMLDARATLDAFMVDGAPDEARMRAQLGPVMERAARSGSSPVVCAYGEMVDLLCRDGNADAAVRLESLWNGLAQTYAFSLLCAYSLESFSRAADADPFLRICHQHEHVVPTERYTRADDGARLLEISALQQRAQALEAEVAHRRELEAQLRASLAEQERLLRLEREARAEAEAANRAKSDFLGVMSHELRTPLNAIAGYVSLLEMGVHGPVRDEQKEPLERIRRSQRHLLGLIDQVLTFALTEGDSQPPACDAVPMDALLRAADVCVLPQMHEKGILYTCSGCDPALAARGDAEKVHQIVLNLLDNATRFTEPGGCIHVACEAAGDEVRVRVRDTGIGVPSDKLEAIFEPFVQADANLTRAYGGVGLGLAISRTLAAAMGGRLTVESVPGAGSTFTLSLPRAAAAEREREHEHESDEALVAA
ncbi:MAG TPA: ATP-binding protein [Longimicrobium sp.]